MAPKEIIFYRHGSGDGAEYQVQYHDAQGFSETTIDMADGDTWQLKDGDMWTEDEVVGLITQGLNIRVEIEIGGEPVGEDNEAGTGAPRDDVERAKVALRERGYGIYLPRTTRRDILHATRAVGYKWLDIHLAVADITDPDHLSTPEWIRREAQGDLDWIDATEEKELMTPARG